MADNQVTPFQLTDQFTMENFNQRIEETNTALQKKADTSSVYTKEESISAETRTALGLSETATPDAALAEIARQLPGTVESTYYPGCYYHTVDGVTEWLNPPLQLGVEYRTTERYQGKPVYTKVVNFGAIPNATYKIVEYGGAECRSIFGYGTTTYSNTFPSLNFGTLLANSFSSDSIISLWFNANQITIACGGDRSSVNAYVVVKYWKTTD